MAQKAVRGPESFLAGVDWLMSGIDIDQPKALKARIKSSWILAEILHKKNPEILDESGIFQAFVFL